MNTQEIVIIVLDTIMIFLLISCLMAIGSNRNNIKTLTAHYNGLFLRHNALLDKLKIPRDFEIIDKINLQSDKRFYKLKEAKRLAKNKKERERYAAKKNKTKRKTRSDKGTKRAV